MAAKKQNRCWPGYEPVPGKKEHSEGSCRPKAESKSTPAEQKFRAQRKRQLDKWQEEHPKTRRSAAQHLSKPGQKKTATASKKKTTPRKAVAKKGTARKRA